MYRALIHRQVLTLAAAYNLGFGLWAAGWPRSFFDLFGLEPPRYPSIWGCLGMVVGLYGLVYGYSALHLDRARPFVALGLLGKVLGPVGWWLAVRSGELPLRTFTLILFNDLVWWLPFSLILLEGTRAGERLRGSAPYACAALNALASLGLVFLLRPGLEVVPDAGARAGYIQENPAAWRTGWLLWIVAASSLVAFYAWWGARLPRPGWGLAAFFLASAGLGFDVLAESLFVAWVPEGAWLPADLERISRLGSILTGGAANGLYTTAGVILTLGTPGLPGWLSLWLWTVWVLGYALTISALLGSVAGMAVSTALLLALFCPLAAVLGRRLR